ncbi:MAG: hypothetical protein PGN09_09790 [Sphingomonas fennica]
MQTFLFILVVLLAIGALVSLVRGVIIFMTTTREDIMSGSVSQSGLRQNRMMWRRVQFQAAAVLVAALLMWLARP